MTKIRIDMDMNDINLVASISNAVLGMTGTVTQQQLVFTTLGFFDPFTATKTLESDPEFAREKNTVIASRYRHLVPSALSEYDKTITLEAIVLYFEKRPELRTFRIEYNDYLNIWKSTSAANNLTISAKNHHKQINDNCKSMTNASMTQNHKIMSPSGREISVSQSFPLISRISVAGLSHIEVKLNAEFMPYIIKLNELFSELGYTKFPLLFLGPYDRGPALSLTQLIIKKFWDKKGARQSFQLSLEDFKAECGIPEDEHKQFKYLNRDFIKKAVNTINDNKIPGTTMQVEITPIKRSRQVTGLEITVDSKDLFELKTKKIGNPYAQKIRNINTARKELTNATPA